jgi:hypothetical protein
LGVDCGVVVGVRQRLLFKERGKPKWFWEATSTLSPQRSGSPCDTVFDPIAARAQTPTTIGYAVLRYYACWRGPSRRSTTTRTTSPAPKALINAGPQTLARKRHPALPIAGCRMSQRSVVKSTAGKECFEEVEEILGVNDTIAVEVSTWHAN